ncbi:MAG: hypothetical protein QNJ71_02010 [Acidimicrobiia bacterium]|nr:hypothetical protein [Acidimicrobiia bacterium]
MDFACPTCNNHLVIETDGSVDPDDVATPDDFMKLKFRLSSAARWACPEHGPIGRVTVAVIDDHVEFVPPEELI